MTPTTILFVGISIMFNISSLPRVLAEDGWEIEGEAEDVVLGIGIAGIVLFGLAALNGIIILLSTRPPVARSFKKIGIKTKYLWKIHHPLVLAALALCLIHAFIIAGNGYWELSEDGALVGWIAIISMVLLSIAGIFFPKARRRWRTVLRIIHFSLMIIAAVYIGLHAATDF